MRSSSTEAGSSFGVLGDKLAAEGLGEQGGCQPLDLGAGCGVAGFEAIGVGEERFDAADNLRLFLKWRQQRWSS